MKFVGPHVHIMMSMGVMMVLIFIHIFFAPTRKLTRAVAEENWPQAGESLAQIRLLIGINLTLGLIIVAIASGGRYFFA